MPNKRNAKKRAAVNRRKLCAEPPPSTQDSITEQQWSDYKHLALGETLGSISLHERGVALKGA